MGRHAATGEIAWIGSRPGRDLPMSVVDAAQISATEGIVGDRFKARRNMTRAVTLIQEEHLPVVAALIGARRVEPDQLRRNIVVRGINLLALIDNEFELGPVVLRGTGRCHPCSKMETNLGLGGYNAMRGHGGITASVVVPGVIRVGDPVRLHRAEPALASPSDEVS